MSDRAYACIRIGGAVTKKDWKKVKKALEEEFGEMPELEELLARNECLDFVGEEADGDPFWDLRAVLRDAGLTYVVEQCGCLGAWQENTRSWDPVDAHRGDAAWRTFYDAGTGEHIQLTADGERSYQLATRHDLQAAFTIAEAKHENPMKDWKALVEDVVSTCFRTVEVPPLTLREW